MRKLLFVALAGLLMVATVGVAASAQETAQPEPAPLTEVADGVYHFWDSGYSSLVVIGRRGVLVTDTAFAGRAETMKAEIAKITDKPVKWVVMSHEHYDHVGGSEVFPDARVYCHQACEEIFELSPLLPVPDVDRAYRTYDDRLTLHLGSGQRVRLQHIAPADGVATTVVRVNPSNVVFSADLYDTESFTVSEFKEDTNFVGLRKTLNTMLDWNPTYAINGHSPGNSLDAMRDNATLYNDLYDIVIEETEQAIAEGGVGASFSLIFTLPGEVTLDGYDHWDNFENGFPTYVRRMALSIIHGG